MTLSSRPQGLKFSFAMVGPIVLVLAISLYALYWNIVGMRAVEQIDGWAVARRAEGYRISFDIFYFVIIYSVVAPFWVLKAIFNALVSKESSWILEREVKVAKQ